MELFYTPRSHFSRKVRLLLDGWGVSVELRDVGNVAGADAGAFGPNPLMKVPTLVDDSIVVFDSDHIAAYLTRKCDPGDRYGVLTDDADLLNLRAVTNGIMAAEVELLLARRTGIETRGLARFEKIEQAIRTGLEWLERHAALYPSIPSYAGFHLVSLWDHLALYDLVELPYERLRELVARLSESELVARSAPR
jgi:glutathione S-transferase